MLLQIASDKKTVELNTYFYLHTEGYIYKLNLNYSLKFLLCILEQQNKEYNTKTLIAIFIVFFFPFHVLLS